VARHLGDPVSRQPAPSRNSGTREIQVPFQPPHNWLLHLSGAMSKEAITSEPLEVQTDGALRAPSEKPPAGERSVMPQLIS